MASESFRVLHQLRVLTNLTGFSPRSLFWGTAMGKRKEYPSNWAWQIQGPYAQVTPACFFSTAAASSGFINSINAASSSSSLAHHQPPLMASAILHPPSIKITSEIPPYFFRS